MDGNGTTERPSPCSAVSAARLLRSHWCRNPVGCRFLGEPCGLEPGGVDPPLLGGSRGRGTGGPRGLLGLSLGWRSQLAKGRCGRGGRVLVMDALSEPLAGAFFIFVPSKVRVRVSRRGADDGASGQRVLPSLYAVPVRLTRTFFDLHPLLPAAAPRWDRDGARLPHVACGVLGGDYTLAAGAVQWLGSSKMVGTRRPTSGRSEPGQRGLSLTWSASPAPAAVRAPSETGLLHSGARLP